MCRTILLFAALVATMTSPLADEAALDAVQATPAQTANMQTPLPIVSMHKNPGCGCCEVWADHLRSFGFEVAVKPDPEILALKDEIGVPAALMSCHTAVIDGYFVEGHVPAHDILQLLKEKPQNVAGIAVPGMPLGSPGMEHPRPQDFKTIAVQTDGTAYVYKEHTAGEDFSSSSKQ